MAKRSADHVALVQSVALASQRLSLSVSDRPAPDAPEPTAQQALAFGVRPVEFGNWQSMCAPVEVVRGEE